MHIAYDLHIHTNFSDGDYSPAEIITLARDKNIKGIALTDHDAVCRLPDSLPDDIDIHVGIEFSTSEQNVHILGYGLDYTCRDLQLFLDHEQMKRRAVMIDMVEKCRRQELSISMDEVIAVKGEAEGALGRPHIAMVMIIKKYVGSIYEAFYKYLGTGKSCYTDYQKFTPEKIIEKIHHWNGIAVIAHPGAIKPPGRGKEALMRVIDAGIDGIEAYYPRHTSKKSQYYVYLAEKHNLLITGGSDFHGRFKKDIILCQAGVVHEYYREFQNALHTKKQLICQSRKGA